MPTLDWIGKDKVLNHHNEVPYRLLDKKYSHGNDADGGNMIIHGDNLEALKALLPQYEGRIKCIYIDPPYNTGEEGWIYNDNVNDPKMKKWIGEVVGKEGDDLSRHDKWLCMMYPRLRLLQKLLSEDGVIFISMDDNEYANLKLICDEIFGNKNYIANFIWEKRKNRENRKVVSSRHDYILCYAKNIVSGQKILKQLPMTGEALERYKNPDDDPRGPWKSDPAIAQGGHGTKNQFYTLVAPNGNKFDPPLGCCWRFTEEKMKEAIDDNRIWFGKDGNNVPRKKTYLYEKERGLTPETIWFADDVSTNEMAKNHLKNIFINEVPFVTPKPLELIERIIQIATDENDIILDSFAGSGTTAHAVLNMNHKDGGNRKFILIEMMDYSENITAERVRRVIGGYGEGKNTVSGTGGSFSYYELGEQLFSEDGNLNPAIGKETVREYIWHMETHSHYVKDIENANPYYLSTYNGTAYYFYYEKNRKTALDADFLKTISENEKGYVIYADICTIADEMLQKMNVTFKKIPRDIAKL